MTKIPEGGKPFQPPMISPKDVGKKSEISKEPAKVTPESMRSSTRGPYELDAQSMAVRLAVMAREVESETMFRIIQKAIKDTGMTNPQAAMEEINKKIQKEIEEVLDDIKNNKDLMEEAEAWQGLANILERDMTEEQAKAFVDIIEGYISK
ncbi:MAG: hypothetical protein V1843_03205 [bacterium]